MKKNPRLRLHQSGMSLVECSTALVILGVTALVLWQFVLNRAQHRTSQQSMSLLQRAHKTIDAYAMLHGNLPCPAKDVQGRQGDDGICNGAVNGFVPYLTLGLPEAAAGKLSYIVNLPHGAPFDPYWSPPEITPLIISGSDRVIDLCAMLSHKTTDAESSTGSVTSGLAYTLRSDATVKKSELVSRSQLGSRLQCAALYANAGRAHYNAQLVSDTMLHALGDYKTQLDISYVLAGWNVAQGSWLLTNAILNIQRKTQTLMLALSYQYSLYYVNVIVPAVVIPAAGYLATASLHVPIYSSQLAAQVINLQKARELNDDVDKFFDKARKLNNKIASNAMHNSSSVFFLAEQKSQPPRSRQ